jgi:malate dehydrogenase
MKNRLTVIGAGNVGATVAMRVAEKELADVVLIDVLEGVPAGKALDLAEASPIERHDARITGVTNDYGPAEGSDIVVITAGIPRKPGMSRDDLLSTNAGIMKSVVTEIAKVAPRAILIVVTNPLR